MWVALADNATIQRGDEWRTQTRRGLCTNSIGYIVAEYRQAIQKPSFVVYRFLPTTPKGNKCVS